VNLTTFASASDPEAVVDMLATSIAKEGKLLSLTRLKIGPDAARHLQVEMEEGQVVLTMLVVTDGTRLYQVSCIALKGNEHSANIEHFVSSFALVP
jgi:hypothetical protein